MRNESLCLYGKSYASLVFQSSENFEDDLHLLVTEGADLS